MANTTNLRIMANGERDVVVHAVHTYVDTANDADVVVVDASALSLTAGYVLTVEKVCYSTCGAWSGRLSFDATTDVAFAALPQNHEGTIDYRKFGGLSNNAGSGISGDILLDVFGTGAAGAAISLVIYCKK